jgi:hypothetical protein
MHTPFSCLVHNELNLASTSNLMICIETSHKSNPVDIYTFPINVSTMHRLLSEAHNSKIDIIPLQDVGVCHPNSRSQEHSKISATGSVIEYKYAPISRLTHVLYTINNISQNYCFFQITHDKLMNFMTREIIT